MQPSAQIIQSDADWHLHKIDLIRERALLLGLNENLYRQASFLDERIESQTRQGYWYPINELSELFPATETKPLRLIFHIGHCGSTLLSRALAADQSVLPLREPLSLRFLADARREQALPVSLLASSDIDGFQQQILQALQRSYQPDQYPMVKASSICNNLIEPLLKEYSDRKAVLMYMSLEVTLASLLGRSNPAVDVRGFAKQRIQDWHTITQDQNMRLSDLDYIQLAVLSWLTNMYWLTQASKKLEKQTLMVNFEDFLKSPLQALEHIGGFFNLPNTTLIQNHYAGVSGEYSKQPGTAYTAQDRQKRLDYGRLQHADGIRRGLEFAQQLIAQQADLADCAGYLHD